MIFKFCLINNLVFKTCEFDIFSKILRRHMEMVNIAM